MADRNFEVGGRKFQLSKINSLKQFHIVRRIAPILGEMLPAIKEISRQPEGKVLTEAEQMEMAVKFGAPFLNGLAKLNDKDSEFVLYALLSGVEMQQDQGNWAFIVKNDMLMFSDLDMPLMLAAAGRSFMFNMAGFFDVLQRLS